MIEAKRFTFESIGVVRSPFVEKAEAPRQAVAGDEVAGTIELFPGRFLEHAVEDLDGWEYLWVLFVFDRVTGWRPKVLPPRSARRRGVLATRSPHRPNPIGMSAVRLAGVQGLNVHIRGLDVLDGTPVLDLKPYVAWSDARPDAGSGWLAAPGDPARPWTVAWHEPAMTQVAWLAARGVDVAGPVERTLTLGPQPHPYRRIRREGGAFRLAWKDWRIHFEVDEPARTVRVLALRSGFRVRDDAAMDEAHRAFVATFC